MMLKIAYFYPDELNLYGDTGNVEVFQTRASLRGFDTEVLYITSTTQITPALMSGVNLVFMGGGPDSGQKHMYQDLITNKGPFLRDYILQGGVGLYICGSYQLLGNYYKTADATVIEGLGILDFYTQHFGQAKPRCVGNMVCTISPALQQNQLFTAVNTLGTKLVGFENHGGRTYLSPTITPLALVLTGHGNNSEDNTEGLLFKNTIGTYFHGPFLSKNAHIADFLIAAALRVAKLPAIDHTLESFIKSAHESLVFKYS